MPRTLAPCVAGDLSNATTPAEYEARRSEFGGCDELECGGRHDESVTGSSTVGAPVVGAPWLRNRTTARRGVGVFEFGFRDKRGIPTLPTRRP